MLKTSLTVLPLVHLGWQVLSMLLRPIKCAHSDMGTIYSYCKWFGSHDRWMEWYFCLFSSGFDRNFCFMCHMLHSFKLT